MIMFLKKVALLTIVLFIGIGAANCDSIGLGTGKSKVDFIYDWDEAQETAQAENKPIMISFYTNSCIYCRKLDSNTYSDDELSTFLNNNFVCLKSNAEKSNLHNTYGVDAYPWIIFTSPDGTKLGQIVGYHSADSFYQYAQGILSRWES